LNFGESARTIQLEAAHYLISAAVKGNCLLPLSAKYLLSYGVRPPGFAIRRRCIQFAPTIRAKTISADLTPLEASFSRTTCFIYRRRTPAEQRNRANFLFHAARFAYVTKRRKRKLRSLSRERLSFFTEKEKTPECFQNESGFLDFLFSLYFPKSIKSVHTLIYYFNACLTLNNKATQSFEGIISAKKCWCFKFAKIQAKSSV
jgi:hypothetical protein